MAEVKMPESLDDRFPGNSDKQKSKANRTERHDDVVKDVDPVVEKGSAKHRKKSFSERLKESLVGNEDGRGVVDYIFYDVLIPAAKDTLFEAITGGLSMSLFGDSRGYSRSPKTGTFTNYNKYTARSRNYTSDSYPTRSTRTRETRVIRTPTNRDYSDDVIFDERSEAMEVLDRLCSVIDACGYATVADLHQFAGMEVEYVDHSRGWVNLNNARVLRLTRGENAGGYLLSLPLPEPLDDRPPF